MKKIISFKLSIAALVLSLSSVLTACSNSKQGISFEPIDNLKVKNYSNWTNNKGILTVESTKDKNQLYWINGKSTTKMDDFYENAKVAVNPQVLFSWNDKYAVFSALYKNNTVPGWFIIDQQEQEINLNSLKGLEQVSINNCQVIDASTLMIFGNQQGYFVTYSNNTFSVIKFDQPIDTFGYSADIINSYIISFTYNDVPNNKIWTYFYNFKENTIIEKIEISPTAPLAQISYSIAFNDNTGIIMLSNLTLLRFDINNNNITLTKLDFDAQFFYSIDKFNNLIVLSNLEKSYFIDVNYKVNKIILARFVSVTDNLGLLFSNPVMTQVVYQDETINNFQTHQLLYNNEPIQNMYKSFPLNQTMFMSTISDDKNPNQAFLFDKYGNVVNLNRKFFDLGQVNNNLSIGIDYNTNQGYWIVN